MFRRKPADPKGKHENGRLRLDSYPESARHGRCPSVYDSVRMDQLGWQGQRYNVGLRCQLILGHGDDHSYWGAVRPDGSRHGQGWHEYTSRVNADKQEDDRLLAKYAREAKFDPYQHLFAQSLFVE